MQILKMGKLKLSRFFVFRGKGFFLQHFDFSIIYWTCEAKIV